MLRPAIGLAAAVSSMLLAAGAAAHEGHDHGAPPPPVSSTIAPRADASSNDFEVGVIARGDRLRLYVDTFRGNDPVRDAVVEIDTPAGTQKAEPDGQGAYEVAAPWLARPGRHDLAITVQAAGLVDVLAATLTIPAPSSVASGGWRERMATLVAFQGSDLAVWLVAGLAFVAGIAASGLWRRWRSATAVLVVAFASAVVPGGAGHASEHGSDVAMAIRDVAQRFPDGAVFVPKPTQRILSIRTLFTETRTYSGTVELPGRIIPDPNGAGFVQASVSGRLTPPPGGFPRLGARVTAGDVLAFFPPAVAAPDGTSQQHQARGADQQIALPERRPRR
ncbi:MAG: RND transporter, partial [Reyranella sp.]|nr:RND transporter [Reyranella sp.]